MYKFLLKILTKYAGFFFDHFHINWDTEALKKAFNEGPVIFCFTQGGLIESFILRRLLLKSHFPELGASQASGTNSKLFIDCINQKKPILLFLGESETRNSESETWSERFFATLTKNHNLPSNITVIPLLLIWQKVPENTGRKIRKFIFGSRLNPNIFCEIFYDGW